MSELANTDLRGRLQAFRLRAAGRPFQLVGGCPGTHGGSRIKVVKDGRVQLGNSGPAKTWAATGQR